MAKSVHARLDLFGSRDAKECPGSLETVATPPDELRAIDLYMKGLTGWRLKIRDLLGRYGIVEPLNLTVETAMSRAFRDRERFEEISSPDLPRELESFGALARKHRHDVRIRNDRRVLVLGMVTYRQTEFLLDLERVMRDGSIDEIEAGLITGPKVLTMLNSLRRSATLRPVIVRGNFVVASLASIVIEDTRDDFAVEREIIKQGLPEGESEQKIAARVQAARQRTFLPADVRNFQRALLDLQIYRHCRRLRACDKILYFRFDTSRPVQEIDWSLSHPRL